MYFSAVLPEALPALVHTVSATYSKSAGQCVDGKVSVRTAELIGCAGGLVSPPIAPGTPTGGICGIKNPTPS